MNKEEYKAPAMRWMELEAEDGLLNPASPGGSGSNMGNPDYSQNPF